MAAIKDLEEPGRRVGCAEAWGRLHSRLVCFCVQFGLGHGSLGGDGLAPLGGMELCLGLSDACSVTLF